MFRGEETIMSRDHQSTDGCWQKGRLMDDGYGQGNLSSLDSQWVQRWSRFGIQMVEQSSWRDDQQVENLWEIRQEVTEPRSQWRHFQNI